MPEDTEIEAQTVVSLSEIIRRIHGYIGVGATPIREIFEAAREEARLHPPSMVNIPDDDEE